MQIPVNLQISMPIQAALFRAAQSAMSTIVLTHGKSLDLSRLSFIRYSLHLLRDPGLDALIECQFAESQTSEAGTHYVAKLDMSSNEQLFAKAQFEIIDRKRGLKTSILRNLYQPLERIKGDFDDHLINFENIFEKYSGQNLPSQFEEKWPNETLLIAATETSDLNQAADIHINFHVFGAADSKLPCTIRRAKGLGSERDLIEIIQDETLIAQLN